MINFGLLYINGISGNSHKRCSNAFFPSSVLLLGTWTYWQDIHIATLDCENKGNSLGMASKKSEEPELLTAIKVLNKLGTIYFWTSLYEREINI